MLPLDAVLGLSQIVCHLFAHAQGRAGVVPRTDTGSTEGMGDFLGAQPLGLDLSEVLAGVNGSQSSVVGSTGSHMLGLDGLANFMQFPQHPPSAAVAAPLQPAPHNTGIRAAPLDLDDMLGLTGSVAPPQLTSSLAPPQQDLQLSPQVWHICIALHQNHMLLTQAGNTCDRCICLSMPARGFPNAVI